MARAPDGSGLGDESVGRAAPEVPSAGAPAGWEGHAIDLLVAALVVLALGAWLQGSVGFGMNLVAAPLLLAVDERFVPGPLLVAAGLMTALTLVRERRAVSLGRVGWAFAGRVPGAVAGAATLTVLSRTGLSIVLGVTVLLAVAVSAAGVHVAITRRSLVLAGVVSGFTGTTTSVGGPPMGLLFQHESGPHVRANLAGFFLLGVIASLGLLVATGQFGWEHARLGLLTVVPVTLGFAASFLTHHRVDGERVRPAVLTVAALSAVGLLVRTLV